MPRRKINKSKLLRSISPLAYKAKGMIETGDPKFAYYNNDAYKLEKNKESMKRNKRTPRRGPFKPSWTGRAK